MTVLRIAPEVAGGRSRRADLALVTRNAAVATDVAVALARPG